MKMHIVIVGPLITEFINFQIFFDMENSIRTQKKANISFERLTSIKS